MSRTLPHNVANGPSGQPAPVPRATSQFLLGSVEPQLNSGADDRLAWNWHPIIASSDGLYMRTSLGPQKGGPASLLPNQVTQSRPGLARRGPVSPLSQSRHTSRAKILSRGEKKLGLGAVQGLAPKVRFEASLPARSSLAGLDRCCAVGGDPQLRHLITRRPA